MQVLNPTQIDNIAKLLIAGHIGIIPTDTIYGIHCIADNQELIDRIYKIKERPAEKKFITLISKVEQLDQFNLKISETYKKFMEEKWPGRNTLIFETTDEDTKSFRMPDNEFLKKLINLTGPLVSTSANKHGQPNVKNIVEAISLFEDEIDFYVDGGILEGNASSVFKMENDEVIKIR